MENKNFKNEETKSLTHKSGGIIKCSGNSYNSIRLKEDQKRLRYIEREFINVGCVVEPGPPDGVLYASPVRAKESMI